MFSLSTLISTALIFAAAGAALTALALRSSQNQKDSRELEQRLEQAENKFNDYQQEVSEHFSTTADLVNNLTQNYKEVHEYLADSALKLSNAEHSRAFLESANSQLPNNVQITLSEENLEPPRDWAPKTPGRKGALSEDYGMDEEREDISARTVPSV